MKSEKPHGFTNGPKFSTNSDRYIPTTETDPNITIASLRKKLTEANNKIAELRQQLKNNGRHS